MGRPSWACEKKWAFLQLWKAAYLVARKEKKTKQFWPAFFAAYGALWPKPGLRDAVQETSEDMELGGEDHEEDLNGDASEEVDKSAVAPMPTKAILTMERVSTILNPMMHFTHHLIYRD